MQGIDFLFSIAILILSVVIHEVSHGLAANALGDPTARYAGRLTLNPLKHIDLFGSILLPLLTYWAGGFIFGWAKPVPYNPYNFAQSAVGAGGGCGGRACSQSGDCGDFWGRGARGPCIFAARGIY